MIDAKIKIQQVSIAEELQALVNKEWGFHNSISDEQRGKALELVEKLRSLEQEEVPEPVFLFDGSSPATNTADQNGQERVFQAKILHLLSPDSPTEGWTIFLQQGQIQPGMENNLIPIDPENFGVTTEDLERAGCKYQPVPEAGAGQGQYFGHAAKIDEKHQLVAFPVRGKEAGFKAIKYFVVKTPEEARTS